MGTPFAVCIVRMERRNLERHDRLWVVDAEEMRWTCRFKTWIAPRQPSVRTIHQGLPRLIVRMRK